MIIIRKTGLQVQDECANGEIQRIAVAGQRRYI
jgi:hypothetical protein